jgi:twitching motility two-component system response regulator PilG
MSQATALDLLKRGVAAARAGDKALTRNLLRQVTEIDPKNEAAWLWLAGVAESALQTLEYLEQALTINPANEKARDGARSARLQAGLDAVRAKDRPLARRLLTQAAQDQPNNEAIWLHLAAVTDAPLEAIGHLEKALQLNPANERARKGISYYRGQLSQTANPVWECPLCQGKAEAKQTRCPHCGAVLTLVNLDALSNNASLDRDRLRKAVDRLADQVRQKPDYAGHLNLGLAHLNLDQFDEAVAQFQAALRLRPAERALRTQIAALVERAAAREQAQGDAGPRRVVLIVDDSATIRKVVSMTLENGGHQVLAAADSEEAINTICTKGVPDLILLDITMPGMDGYQLCKLLRQEKATHNVPIVMLSGKDGFFSKIRGRMAGSTDYVTKPFRPNTLLHLVDKYCGAGLARA